MDEHYTRIPRSVIAALPKIGWAAAAVYMVLADHVNGDGECWPSQERLAAAIGASDRTVRSALSALESAGMVIRKKTRGVSSYHLPAFMRKLPSELTLHMRKPASNLDGQERKPASSLRPEIRKPASGLNGETGSQLPLRPEASFR